MLSSRRGHPIDVSYNIYRRHNFSDRLRQCFQVTFKFGNENHKSNDFFRFIFSIPSRIFIALRKSCLGIFLKFQKNCLRKTAWWSLCLQVLQVSAPTRPFFWNFFNFQRILPKEQLWTTALKLFDIFPWNFPIIPELRWTVKVLLLYFSIRSS